MSTVSEESSARLVDFEPEDHSTHRYYQICPGGLSVFLSVCVLCLTAFLILVGMGLVDVNALRALDHA